MSNPLSVAILGASGYTGAEAIRLLAAHKQVKITALAAQARAGLPLAQVFPQFAPLALPALVKPEEIDWQGIDVAICGLPHGAAQDVLKTIPQNVKLIDMSADFRLNDTSVYADWYGRAHDAPALLAEAVYGLTEHYRDEIKKARLVACPGCYPTGILTLLLPLIKAKLIDADDIIIDAKSGVTGAGRSLKESNLFSEVAEATRPYAVGGHRHAPEIEQELSKAAKQDIVVNFTPHLVPMNRGELITIYAKTNNKANADGIRQALRDAYQGEPFIHIVGADEVPTTARVRGSNMCLLGAYDDRLAGRVILIAALDNLVKGSSGQAVQNMNLMFGLDETSGLTAPALYP